MISIVAKFSVHANKSEEFISLAKEMVKTTVDEAGCIAYVLNQSVKDENEYVMIEQWQDQASLDAHNESEHFKGIVPKMVEICEFDVEVYQPV